MKILGYLNVVIVFALLYIHGAQGACQDDASAWGFSHCIFFSCTEMMDKCPQRCDESSAVAKKCCGSCTAAKAKKKDPKYDRIAEIYFVIDPKGVEKYESFGYSLSDAKKRIDSDLEYFIAKANDLFSTLDKENGIRFRIAPVFTEYLSSDIFVDNKISIDGSPMLGEFDRYISRVVRRRTRLQFDAAILFTGYNPPDAQGIAYTKTMCYTQATGMVRLTGTAVTYGTLAHEIAHIIGSYHDEGSCEQYHTVMETVAKHPTHFSDCSLSDIKIFMQNVLNPNNNCLIPYYTSAKAISYKGNLNVPVIMKDPIAMCKRRYGKYARQLCVSKYTGKAFYGDLFCEVQYCYYSRRGSTGCFRIEIFDGTTCDTGKVCDKMKCVSETSSESRLGKREIESMFVPVPEGTIYYDKGEMPEEVQEEKRDLASLFHSVPNGTIYYDDDEMPEIVGN